MDKRYCIDLANFERFPSQVVKLGDVSLGGGNPIRLQSMTNTNTMDLHATVAQCKRIFDAGADFVRITTPGEKEARFLAEIKKALHAEGYKQPLIADVHFQPKAAEIAAEIIEKVRINPGNYVDPRANFKRKELSQLEYDLEIERMHQRLLPLINVCKKNGTAIRIGSNHGSLSDRIINRYGNTPRGMVEAAMEFYRIFLSEGFENLVISMKSSTPAVMVEACRLLNAAMMEEGIVFPQHLGVTEAGEGAEGRLRSAIGIGALLADGIGDTVRVSLTEAPEKEIPVAQQIVSEFAYQQKGVCRIPIYTPSYQSFSPIDKSNFPETLKYPAVFADLRDFDTIDDKYLPALNYTFNQDLEKYLPDKRSPEYLLVNEHNAPKQIFKTHLVYDKTDVSKAEELTDKSNPKFIECFYDDLDETEINALCEKSSPVFILKTETDHHIGELRSFLNKIQKIKEKCPVILSLNGDNKNALQTAAKYGAALVENQLAGIMLRFKPENIAEQNNFAWDLLQAAGVRRSKVEFVSCPGCGRTLYDLEKTTQMIKREFGHLGEIKIAIMGCIVNGPGEMLDADYGYIGGGNGKVTLYKGQKAVAKNIPESEAVEALKEILKQNNDWKEP